MSKIIEKALKGISMPTFYKWGSILLFFGLIGAFISVVIQWDLLEIGGKITIISRLLFQALFLTLFLSLYIQTRKTLNSSDIINNPNLDNFLKELQEEDEEIENKKPFKNKMKGGLKNG